MKGALKIAINGFGRIGRTVTRQVMQGRERNEIEIVLINDIAPLETCAYLFRFDSAFGAYPGTAEFGSNAIRIDDRTIPFHSSRDLKSPDLSGVDMLLECTGQVSDRAGAEAGLSAGARNVLISGPSDDADTTIVLGANEQELGHARIVSNASCTTNAIAPLLRKLDLGLGIVRAHVTTIHCYTGSQPTVDAPGASLARSRAAAVSMIPTSTSAAEQVLCVLPEFQGRLSVSAVRVPCLSVSAIDAVLQLAEVPEQLLIDYLRDSFGSCHLIGLTEDACVSTDLRARPESLIIALPETQVTGGNQLRIFGWYDNEWGFSARMIDMARRMVAKEEQGDNHGIRRRH
jgi:glyceraldehyde 3-phosphate dehydrogenase